MTLRRVAGEWIESGGTLRFTAGLFLKALAEITLILVATAVFDPLLRRWDSFQSILRLLVDEGSPVSAGLVTGVATLYVLCSWDSSDAEALEVVKSRLPTASSSD